MPEGLNTGAAFKRWTDSTLALTGKHSRSLLNAAATHYDDPPFSPAECPDGIGACIN